MAGLWEPVDGVFWSVSPTVPDEGWPLSVTIIVALVAAFAFAVALKFIAKKIKPAGWHLREYLGEIGGALTLTYLVIVVVVIWGRADTLMTMPLNEVGDFLAGAFGPVAFLWLVFGFLQQGDELRQGTKALELQAFELRNSVEQQAIMAAAALEQIDAQKGALELQHRERERTLVANFSMTTTSSGSGSKPGILMNKVNIRNDGNAATNIVLTFSPPFLNHGELQIGRMQHGSAPEFELTMKPTPDPVEGTVRLSYEDVEGKTRTEKFTYRIVGGRTEFKKVRTVSA
jgi:hypothetical protein